jgi:hypothetical protein
MKRLQDVLKWTDDVPKAGKRVKPATPAVPTGSRFAVCPSCSVRCNTAP